MTTIKYALPTVALAILIQLCGQTTASAQILTSYTFNKGTSASSLYATNVDTSAGDPDAGANSILPSTTAAGLVTGNTLSLLSGDEAYWAYTQTYTGFGFGVAGSSNYPTTEAGAKTANLGYTFTIAPTAGGTLDLTSVDFSGATLFSKTFNPGGGNPVEFGNRDAYLVSDVAGNTELGTFSFDQNGTITSGSDTFTLGSAFSNLTGPVTFTLYISAPDTGVNSPGVSNSDSTGLIAGSLTINGSVTSVPEPSTYVLMGLSFLGLVFMMRRSRSQV